MLRRRFLLPVFPGVPKGLRHCRPTQTYSRCPYAQPFVKVGARAPVPYGVDAGAHEYVSCESRLWRAYRAVLSDKNDTARHDFSCAKMNGLDTVSRRDAMRQVEFGL